MGDIARMAVIPPWPGGVDNFWPYANIGGQTYPLSNLQMTMPSSPEEAIESNFASYVQQAYKRNAVVFACMLARMALFSQARFRYRGFANGELFGNPSLDILARPWTNATTGDLLARAITDVDAAGTFFATRRKTRTSDRIIRLRPDWVTLVHGSESANSDPDDLDAEFLGVIFYPGGEYSGSTPEYIQRSQLAVFAPIPDPEARTRGLSWITPIVRDVMGDSAATTHKLKFFENGGTPNLVIKRADAPDKTAFNLWRQMMEEGHAGLGNAYKTLYLTAGADATVVGKDLQQLDFKITTGAGETRIASASGIHPVVVGLSEGMQGASLNAGNFASARRLTADKTLWWLWSNFCGSMETLVPPPQGSQLWIDSRDIPFLREDRKDAAEIQQIKSQTIRNLVDAGYKAESVVKAVDAEDMTLLVHSGLFSVQLQKPGERPGQKPAVTPKE